MPGETLAFGGGGPHCITQQIPVGVDLDVLGRPSGVASARRRAGEGPARSVVRVGRPRKEVP